VFSLRSLGRSIAFPGSTSNVQREMSADFLRKLLNKIDNLSQITASFCGAFLAFAGGNLRSSEFSVFQKRATEMPVVLDAISALGEWLSNIQSECRVKNGKGCKTLNSLLYSIEELSYYIYHSIYSVFIRKFLGTFLIHIYLSLLFIIVTRVQ
jgi:hypothetical protein